MNHEEEVSISLNNEVIQSNKSVKLLGIKIDNKLDFKLHGLAKVAPFVNKEKL